MDHLTQSCVKLGLPAQMGSLKRAEQAHSGRYTNERDTSIMLSATERSAYSLGAVDHQAIPLSSN